MVPPTKEEIELFDYNRNKKIDDNVEKESLKRNRNFKEEDKFSKEHFDWDKSGFVDIEQEILAYKNYKLGIIANFFSKTGFEKYNSLENIRKAIAEELTTPDIFKKKYQKMHL